MTQLQEQSHRACLIGHTGFVGGILRQQAKFLGFFNSTNIFEIQNDTWDTVVCAAAPGSMFQANKFPERDQEQIQALIDRLERVKTRRFILISSIAVLEDFAGADDESTTAFQKTLAYGRHRRQLESLVEDHFPQSLIVRLPALFGQGLRKNFIFDLLNPVPTMLTRGRLDSLSSCLSTDLKACLSVVYKHDPATDMVKVDREKLALDPLKPALENAVVDLGYSATQFHNPDTTYQYYDMNRLWSDIEVATEASLSHIHLVSEPLKAARIHDRLIGLPMPATSAKIHHEDMRTRHAAMWQTTGPYLVGAETTLDRLAAFFAAEKARA